MSWQHNVCVRCRCFKNREPTARERCPMGSLPLRIACTAEHRNVTRVGFGLVIEFCSLTNPRVVTQPMLVRDGTPLSEPKIQQPTPYPPLYKSPPSREQVSIASDIAEFAANAHCLG